MSAHPVRVEYSAEAAEALAAPIGTGGGAQHNLAIRAGQVAIGVALLLVWQVVSGRLIDPFYISSPDAVAVTLNGPGSNFILALQKQMMRDPRRYRSKAI